MKAALADLARIARASVARRDADYPLFHGCYDWHSAVHGHWALLRACDWEAARRLTPKGIAAERAMLRRHPAFEMPYGRAWLLLLAEELARAPVADAGRLLPMADEVAKSLLDFYREFPPSPMTREYASASWALLRLHRYLAFRRDPRGVSEVDRWIRTRFLDADARASFADDRVSPEFFSVFGLWASLVAQTQDARTLQGFLKRNRGGLRDLAPLRKLIPNPHRLRRNPYPTSHQLGMNWSRAWSMKALGLERAWRAHVRQGLADHRRYAGHFLLYDHWIPQFAVYGMTA